MVNKELIQYQNKLFYIYRKMKPHQIKDGQLNDLKEFYMCDVVVRGKQNNDDTLLFLREIPEAEIVN